MRKLEEVLGFVVHWDGGEVKHGDIEGLIDWMENVRKGGAFYHYFISGDKIIKARDEKYRCIHCGNNTYTMWATRFFGSYHCPPWDHRDQPHGSSPNNCTLSLCMLHDYEDGSFSELTLKTAAHLVGDRLGAYGLSMQALFDHTDIVGRDTKLCPKSFYTKNNNQKKGFIEQVQMSKERIDRIYNRIPR